MKYQGSCHCGQIAFEAEGTLDSALACNCSICQRKGSLLWFVPRTQFVWKTPESNSRSYRFNRHAIQHHFCPHCGIHTHGEGKSPQGEAMAAINIRCLEGIDLATVPVHHFDGRAL